MVETTGFSGSTRALCGHCPAAVRLDEPAEGWAWDPDGSRAAVVTADAAALRLLDLQRMRTLATVRVGARGALAAVSWPA
jgi:hypothetical protein